MKHQIVSRRDSEVLFECNVPDDLESGLRTRHALEQAVAARANLADANLAGANLADANLADANLARANLAYANLAGFRSDLFDVLLRAQHEIPALRDALVAGRVDGSVYEGQCACLVGTIANARCADYRSLGCGLEPNSSRPAEQWFMQIRPGDTPDKSAATRIVVEWIDEFVGLMELAKQGTAA